MARQTPTSEHLRDKGEISPDIEQAAGEIQNNSFENSDDEVGITSFPGELKPHHENNSQSKELGPKNLIDGEPENVPTSASALSLHDHVEYVDSGTRVSPKDDDDEIIIQM